MPNTEVLTSPVRTVADIIAGRLPGVFGVVTAVRKGPLIGECFPTILATLQRPVGLPLCDCGEKGPPHATGWLAGVPCNEGYPAETYRDVCEHLACGILVEFVGDIVPVDADGPPLVSGFFWFRGAKRNMTVPDRATPLNQHCKACPTEATRLSLVPRE